MQELEKILEEIDGMIESYKENPRLENVDICYGLNQAKRIIRKHMKTNETFEFDFSGVESFDCQCGRHYINTAINDGWISEYRERCCFVQYYGGKWSLRADREPIKIIAWRPLPEPYRPERSEVE